MMVLIRFWRSLTKKDRVKSSRYEISHFFYFNSRLRTFFYTDPDFLDRIRIFGRSGSGLRRKGLKFTLYLTTF